MKNYIRFALFLITVVTVAFGVRKFADTTYAKVATTDKRFTLAEHANNIRFNIAEYDIKKLALEAEKRLIESDIRSIHKEFGYGCRECPDPVRDTYAKLKADLEDVRIKLRQLKVSS